jgi:hypothetical protein
MGYDLDARRPKRGAASYYRSGIEFMTFLRSAMVAAGVPEALVYKKFTSNDNLLVTPTQSRMIAQSLTRWLRRRNLTLDLAETNQWTRASTDSLLFVLQAVGNHKDRARLARSRRAKSLPLRMDRRARKTLREFAAFCAGSGGFYVS